MKKERVFFKNKVLRFLIVLIVSFLPMILAFSICKILPQCYGLSAGLFIGMIFMFSLFGWGGAGLCDDVLEKIFYTNKKNKKGEMR